MTVVCGYASHSPLTQAIQLFFAQELFNSRELSTWLLEVVCSQTYWLAGNILISARFVQPPETSGMLFVTAWCSSLGTWDTVHPCFDRCAWRHKEHATAFFLGFQKNSNATVCQFLTSHKKYCWKIHNKSSKHLVLTAWQVLLAVLRDYERWDCLITVACGPGTYVGRSAIMIRQNWKTVWWVCLEQNMENKSINREEEKPWAQEAGSWALCNHSGFSGDSDRLQLVTEVCAGAWLVGFMKNH